MRKLAAILGTFALMGFLCVGVLVWLSSAEQAASCGPDNNTLCVSSENPFSSLGDALVRAAPGGTPVWALVCFGAPLAFIAVASLPYGRNRDE